MSIPWRIGRYDISLAVDTGACANLLSYTSFLCLKDRMPFTNWELRQPDVSLLGVSGTQLHIMGVVTLRFRVARNQSPICADFHVIDNFPLPSDGLLGLGTLSKYNISVCPRSRTVKFRQSDYSALDKSSPLLTSDVIAPVASIPCQDAFPGCVRGGSGDISGVRGANWSLVSAVLSDGQRFHSQTLTKVPVRLPDVKVGTDVVCLSETLRVKGLSLESTLS